MKASGKDTSEVRFLGIDPMVNPSNPPSAKVVLSGESHCVIAGVGITRCGHIDWKDLDTVREEKAFKYLNVYL